MLTFAQLSDPHLSSPAPVRPGDLLGKRFLGYLSWRLRRRHRHRPEVLASLVADLHAARADHVVVTGDLTHLGLPHELEQARAWLDALAPAASLSVVPGNHDVYARGAGEHTLGAWAPYCASDEGRDPSFPGVRVRGPAVFIGLSSARPSPPFLAVGEVGARQLDRLARVLAEARGRDLARIVLLHHPPLAEATGWRKRLVDGARLRAVLAAEGAELVLHGHTHRASIGALPTASGPVPVVGVPSASSTESEPGRRARYHLYRLTREGRGFRFWLSVRAYVPGAGFVAEGPERPLSRSDETATPSPPPPPGPAPAPRGPGSG